MTNEMTEKLGAAIGKTPEETRAMLDKNPKLKKLLSEMNEQDAQRLVTLLGDKEGLSKLLASPQIKSMMDAMNTNSKQ